MPEICRIGRLVITMWPNDHLPPHFHVRHARGEAMVGIDPVRLIEGRLRPSDRRTIVAWARAHRVELQADWDLLRSGKRPHRIAPPR